MRESSSIKDQCEICSPVCSSSSVFQTFRNQKFFFLNLYLFLVFCFNYNCNLLIFILCSKPRFLFITLNGVGFVN